MRGRQAGFIAPNVNGRDLRARRFCCQLNLRLGRPKSERRAGGDSPLRSDCWLDLGSMGGFPAAIPASAIRAITTRAVPASAIRTVTSRAISASTIRAVATGAIRWTVTARPAVRPWATITAPLTPVAAILAAVTPVLAAVFAVMFPALGTLTLVTAAFCALAPRRRLSRHLLVAFSHRRPARQPHSALFIDAQALDPDLITHFDDVLGLLDAEVGQLAYVNQAVLAGQEFDKGAKIFDRDDFAAINLADLRLGSHAC